MSQANPNPEETKRIVDACIKKLRPDMRPQEPNDLERLFLRMEESIKLVEAQMQPMSVMSVTDGSIHTHLGRRNFETTATKLFLDEFTRQRYNREELMLCLAYTHAKQILERVA